MTNLHRPPMFTISNNVEPVYDEQIESKMRVLANYFIDQVLAIQENATKKG